MKAILVEQLHKAVLSFNADERFQLLNKCSAEKFSSTTQTRKYYYTLLFMAGYCMDEKEL